MASILGLGIRHLFPSIVNSAPAIRLFLCVCFCFLATCSDPDFASKSSRYGEFDSETGVWSSPPCNGEWVDPDTGKTETRDYEWTNAV